MQIIEKKKKPGVTCITTNLEVIMPLTRVIFNLSHVRGKKKNKRHWSHYFALNYNLSYYNIKNRILTIYK